MRVPKTSPAPSTFSRDAGFDNISLDLIYGIPGAEAPPISTVISTGRWISHPSTCRATSWSEAGNALHARAARLERQSEAMETYFERVVERLTTAGYRWYETANFARSDERDLRDAQPRLLGGRDYLGLGIGAVSTVGASLAERAEPAGVPGGARGGRVRAASTSRSRMTCVAASG